MQRLRPSLRSASRRTCGGRGALPGPWPRCSSPAFQVERAPRAQNCVDCQWRPGTRRRRRPERWTRTVSSTCTAPGTGLTAQSRTRKAGRRDVNRRPSHTEGRSAARGTGRAEGIHASALRASASPGGRDFSMLNRRPGGREPHAQAETAPRVVVGAEWSPPPTEKMVTALLSQAEAAQTTRHY